MTALKIKLNNGVEMPALGYGTYKLKPEEAPLSIRTAIESGYRHIDCALLYKNEPAIGETLSKCFKDGLVKREEVFITGKLWNTFHRPDLVRSGLKQTLTDLQLDYIDLYLMHTPMAYQEGKDLIPKDKGGAVVEADIDFVDTWREMEKLVSDGLVRSIGVSNFNAAQIDRILKSCTIPPVVNQVEVHPFLQCEQLVEFCTQHNINVTAYNAFSVAGRTGPKPTDPRALEDQSIARIAKKYGKTNAHVIIRWLLQRKMSVLVKSCTPERIKSNIKVWDFELTPEEMTQMRQLEQGFRAVVYTEASRHSDYPFRASGITV